jgi:hypothetical protein
MFKTPALVAVSCCALALLVYVYGMLYSEFQLENIKLRYNEALFSRASCQVTPPSPNCVDPVWEAEIPDSGGDGFDKATALFVASICSLLLKASVGKMPDFDLPGKPDKKILSFERHPALCVTFVHNETRWIVFRGTSGTSDLLDIDTEASIALASSIGIEKFLLYEGVPNIFAFPQTDVTFGGETTCKIHSGFWNAYSQIRPALLNILRSDSKSSQIIIGGHSMGASISQVCATDLSFVSPLKISLYALASTRVGDVSFATLLMEKVKDCWSVINTEDYIPSSIASVIPDFSCSSPQEVLFYSTSARVVSITVHAESVILGHSLKAYTTGISGLS